TLHSIKLTLIVAPIAVGLNVTFGIAAAWAIARFRFPGRTLLTALIDLPFTVSPVVVGLFLLLLFGLQGTFGPWLRAHDLKIVFALPGLVLATAFVTCPVVARELIPLMEAIGAEEEVAAVSLGARGWQLFRLITLPNIKWGLLGEVSLEVPSGALLALLGPSGSGKTTLLRIIAGLEVADAGAVRYHDEDVTHAPVTERNVGFVFQHYALFRHLTVFENVAFGLRVRGVA